MAQPIWITPAGSLGVIPEGIFYQQALRAYTAPLSMTPLCTATSSTTDLITCTSTAGIYPGLQVIFSGDSFGGLQSDYRYFVLAVTNSTQFSVTTSELATTPVALSTATGSLTASFSQHVLYRMIAGRLPEGLQIGDNGLLVGVPLAVASLQGVPTDVSEDVTNKFVIRGYTLTQAGAVDSIADRTFSITVTGDDRPEFITPPGSIGTYYDGDFIDYQIEYTDTDPADAVVIRLVEGELPGGVTVSATGLISGYIEPAINVNETPGYDLTPVNTFPYDFIVSAINKNYQFTLEVSDGKTSSLRTFQFFVYDRASITADNTTITADSTTVTADQGTTRQPFIINRVSDLGVVRGDNYYSYQFIGRDYDTTDLKYAISVNQGLGLPPGLTLDPNTGWYYGYIPDQGATEIDYSFNIVTYQADFVGDPITCTATEFGTNRITCNSTAQLGVGQPLVFTGTGFGGITAAPTTVYYVNTIVSETEFTVTTILNSGNSQQLVNDSGTMLANLIISSSPYPFEITVSGAVDAAVTWLTPEDLGTIDNGDVSLLSIQAVNQGGRELRYRFKTGAFNELPQGLTLFPTGEIAGRVSFNTFSIDLGATTFDSNTTTWDSTFVFTVNAYAEDTGQVLYNVNSVTVVDGGIGYDDENTPAIAFSAPVGATAETATAGTVVVVDGAIVSVAVSNSGEGYTSPATVSVIEGFGGTGAILEANMRETGVRDAVSAFRTFTVRVRRANNKPYQNLEIQAMPPINDRLLVADLLDNENIFNPEYIFRPTDPYFGKSNKVVYQHAFGLAPDVLDLYVESLYKNHYWKNLVLGSIETAQALDADGSVIYEVVYSRIIDNLVNDAGESVNQIVNLPYDITDPLGQTISQVYPNSLVDMRNQVIDTVGQISSKLPLWMTSKQTNGRVLGFTPAWVLAYVKPGYARQVAYYINTIFGEQLNKVDFKVDRYILDTALSKNWDTETQQWTPEPSLTTFDRFSTAGYTYLGQVSIATDLAFADVNERPLSYINELGGLDGEISNIDGNTLIFVKQEDYSNYSDADAAWQDYLYPYDTVSYDFGTTEFDEAITVPKGDGSSFNERMAIYEISVEPVTQIVRLTLKTQTEVNDFVEVVRGNFYRTAQLRYPGSPGEGLTEISWLPLTTIVTTETIFDGGSTAFTEPVDMYDPTDAYDKYLVFPKTNILV